MPTIFYFHEYQIKINF